MSLPRFAVDNPVLSNLFMLTLMIGGVFGGLTLVREMFPETRPDMILISTAYPGATPAEVEKGITLKIEERIKNVEGVDKIIATVSEGNSTVMVELLSGFEEIDQAVNDIKAAIDEIPEEDWPQEALESQVRKFEPKWPVISIGVYGDLDDRMLKDFSEDLRDEMLSLRGITDIIVSGTRKDEISINVRPEKLIEYDLSFIDVADAIAASNLDLPGGVVRTPRMNVSVRTLGEKDRGEELYDIIIRSDAAGRQVGLSHVAEIDDGFEESDVSGRFNGLPAANVVIYKTPDQDAIEIAGMVKALVAGKKGKPFEQGRLARAIDSLAGRTDLTNVYDAAKASPLPPGVELEVHTDLSRFIESRLDLLGRNGMWGLLLVFLSLLLLLNWRVAFWVMMGLLISILGALIFMKSLGLTLNLISMFGMIVVLGMLVDDAIIVAEHVYRKIEQGETPRLAAITGAEEVTWPVICAVTTTMVAFLPLMFVKGQLGDWMGVLPVVVVVALSVSLIEALTVLPCHLASGLKPLSRKLHQAQADAARGRAHDATLRQRLARVIHVDGVRQRLAAGYEWLLIRGTQWRYVTICILLALMFVVGGLVAGGHVPFVFLQKMDAETIVANIEMASGTPITETERAGGVVEQAALDLPELKTVYTLFGHQLSEDMMPLAPQSHMAMSFIEIVPAEERSRNSEAVLQALRDKTDDIPGVERLKFTSMQGGPAGAPIHLEISGDSIEDIVAVSGRVQRRLNQFEGVYDIVDDFDAGRPEVKIELLDSARALGLTTESLAWQVRAAFFGFEARKVQRGREDVKIMVRYPLENRQDLYAIESMYVKTPGGTLVPFREVARISEGTGFTTIHRKNQKRTVTVKADVDEDVTNAEQIIGVLTSEFPELRDGFPGVTFEFGGQNLETRRSMGSLRELFAAVLLLIYVILAALFRSYVQPLIVMSVVPFGLIGAVGGHALMGYPMTFMSMIGLVALTGIVVNDSMILITFINRRVADGTSVYEAVIDGGKSRVRAIVLTSVTTILGLAPLMMETSFQAKFLIPMAISISAGLAFATVLTLVAVPALYLIVHDVAELAKRAAGSVRSAVAAGV